MQKQMLWNSFQEKNKQLEMQHKMQLEHRIHVNTFDNNVKICSSTDNKQTKINYIAIFGENNGVS